MKCFFLPNKEENLQDNGSSEGASNTNFGFTKIVFIDSTWNQCYGMVQHPALAGQLVMFS